MLSERRHKVALKAQFIEMIELWGFAVQPQHRLPEAVILERMRAYYRQQLQEALEDADSGQALGDVLIDLFRVVTGDELVEGWSPPPLAVGAELLMPL